MLDAFLSYLLILECLLMISSGDRKLIGSSECSPGPVEFECHWRAISLGCLWGISNVGISRFFLLSWSYFPEDTSPVSCLDGKVVAASLHKVSAFIVQHVYGHLYPDSSISWARSVYFPCKDSSTLSQGKVLHFHVEVEEGIKGSSWFSTFPYSLLF